MMNEQSLKDRIRVISKENNIPFNACWKQLILERFLIRLGRSSYANKFIFKGGFLLAYRMEIGRETVDLDFLLTKVKAEVKTLEKIFHEITKIKEEDEFAFSFSNLSPLAQPHMGYPGYRITLNVSFGKMIDKIHIDVGIGDVVDPENLEIRLLQYKNRPFFEDSISLLVYPVEAIFAEKLETVLSKGSKNSRMKDYHDLFLIIRNKDQIEPDKLCNALRKTFTNRGTELCKIDFDSKEISSLQKLWNAHLRNLGDMAKELRLPKDINLVVDEINFYLQIHSEKINSIYNS